MSIDDGVIFNPGAPQGGQNQQQDMAAQPPVEETPPDTPIAPPPPIRSGIFSGGLFKKIIIGVVALIIVIILAFVFISRGSGNENAELVWWGLWEDENVMKPLIDEFERENPNIKVEYVKQDPEQYRDKLAARIKNGTGPDIFRFHNTWVPMLSDTLLPLSKDVITPADFKKNYPEVFQDDLIGDNGAIYGVPLGADTLALFVNTDLLSSAGEVSPKTWDDFVKTAKKLTVKDEKGKIKTAGAALGTYANITHAPDIISLLFIQQGIDMDKFPTSGQDQIDALDFYTSFAKGDQSVWDNTLDESLLSFSSGRLAMYIGYSWDIYRIQSLAPDLDFSVNSVPNLPGGNATIASYWVEGVSSKSRNQKAALLFMQHLAKKETVQKFYTTTAKTRAFGELYARSDLGESLKGNKLVYPFVAQMKYAKSSFFASDTYDGEGGLNTQSNIYLQNAINSIVLDNSSTQTAVTPLNNGVTQVFQKYGIQ